MMFEAYLTQEAGHLDPDDIPHTKDPVWVLGKKYRAIDGEYDVLVFCCCAHTHSCSTFALLLVRDMIVGHAMVQAGSYWSVTTVTQVQVWAIPCNNCNRQSGIWTGFVLKLCC